MNRAARHVLLITLGAAACSQPRADAPTTATACTLAVIGGLRTAPTDGTLAELGRASGATLTLTRPMAAGLYLLELTAPGGPAACDAALERLRRDERVLSAELDQQRRIASP